MTQEEKDLLLKDLYARIPYGVKILHQGWNYEWDQELSTLEKVTGIDERFIYTKVIDTHNGEEYRNDKWPIDIFNDKPYLFPLSSMTEEQLYELRELFGFEIEFLNGFIDLSSRSTLEYLEMITIIEWFYKNHFDIHGLIPMGLAKDATGLSIY